MRDFAKAAANTMKSSEPGLGGLMGDLMGGSGNTASSSSREDLK